MISVMVSKGLLTYLQSHEVDGETVDAVLFAGGRLAYPGRRDIEFELGYAEPYTLVHEARVIEGLPRVTVVAIRFLAGIATEVHVGEDPTLDLLWGTHGSYMHGTEGPSLDRLVAALVTINDFREAKLSENDVREQMLQTIFRASEVLVRSFHEHGIPLSMMGLEELFDGADPACLGLGLVELA